jgi:polar amino acid transport system substrate-binding protein
MKAFQELVQTGRLDMDYLTTHAFKLDDAPAAYNLIMEKSEPFLGILLEYDVEVPLNRGRIALPHPPLASVAPHPSSIGIAFIGAGSYAMGNLLPNIPKEKDVLLKGVMTSSGTSSRTVADKYGFEFCTSSEADILGNAGINAVFIATRHNSHAAYVRKALEAGKHVFVEKPLCLKEAELEEMRTSYSSLITRHSSPSFMVGFNRRFSPLTQVMKEKMGSGPMSMIYRINAGHIPADSWIQDTEIGGGRIIGEVCHFIDFLVYLNDSLPVSVFASALPDAAGLQDTVNINITFQNGSTGVIAYFANGPKSLFKEYVEVYRAGTTAILKDFKELQVFGSGKPFTKSLFSQDKGQKEMVRVFIDAIRKGSAAPIPFEDIYMTTLTTFRVLESLRTKSNIIL